MNILSSQIALLVKSMEFRLISKRRQEIAKRTLAAELDVISRRRQELATQALAAEKEISSAIENLHSNLDAIHA